MSKETDLLRRVPLFADLPSDALLALSGRLRRRQTPPGTPVVYKGDPSGALYLIMSGRVKVHQATASGDEVILNVLGSGDFFGEMSLLDGLPRSADISARWSRRSCCFWKAPPCKASWMSSPPSPGPCYGR